uniref:Cytochrome P450 n=1 Tax=Mycena chlorophos TaxID=658473 RepID=A0ABQ0M5E5_MYCCL|nr:predicted protein [Mycena chlorophos]
MSSNELIVGAAALGLANHAYFRRFEPGNAHHPVIAVVLQSFLLVGALHYLDPERPLTLFSALRDYITAFFVLVSTLTASIFTYRLAPWHPLAHVPGPLGAKLSKVYMLRHAVTGQRSKVLKALHDQYGEVVRIGPNEVSIASAEAITSVLGAGGYPKGPFYKYWGDPTFPAGNLLTLTGEPHTHRRRIWNRGMTASSLKDFEAILSLRMTLMLERFDGFAAEQKPIDLAEWCNYLTVDFMGDVAFGGGFELMRDGEDRDGMFRIVKMGIKAMSIQAQMPWISPTLKLLPGFKEVPERLHEFSNSRAEARVKAGAKTHKDMWYHLMDEEGKETRRPTLAEVIIDGGLAIVAGSDTSAMTLASFLWRMLMHPEIHARVRAEVDKVYPDGEGILSSDKHNELVFLSACLSETLRMHPPVPSGGSRRVPSGQAKVVSGTLIPDNTDVFVPTYAIQLSPKNFYPAPESFDPDRWLRAHSSSDGEVDGEVLNQAAFVPFSFGPANCAAKNLAWREVTMACAALVRRYDMSFVKNGGGERWADEVKDFYVNQCDDMMVDIRLRDEFKV